MDLDDLLEDLQSALPPELQVPTPVPPSSGPGNQANGHMKDHYYDRMSDNVPERASVASASTHFDDEQYSEVRRGPLYVPGQGQELPGEVTSPPPTTGPSPPPSKPPRDSNPPRDSLGASAGLAELDSLLDLLNDTQIKIDKAMDLLTSRPAGSQIRSRSERVSVATCSVRDRDREPWRGDTLGVQQQPGRGATTRNSAIPTSSSYVVPKGSLTFSKSATMLGHRRKPHQPITERVLMIGREMDDPRATDLTFLFEDAKLLHQKLMALNMEEVDLKKVGLFSNETLEAMESSARKMREKAEQQRRASLASSNSSLSSSGSNQYQSLGSLANGINNGSMSMPRKGKSLKRGIFSRFGRSKSSKHESERKLAAGSSRHSVATLIETSSCRSTSPVRKKSFGRSSSLDFLDCNSDSPEESPPPSSAHLRGSPPAGGYKMRLARSFSSLYQTSTKKRDRSATLKPSAKSSADVEINWKYPNVDSAQTTPTTTSNSSPKTTPTASSNSSPKTLPVASSNSSSKISSSSSPKASNGAGRSVSTAPSSPMLLSKAGENRRSKEPADSARTPPSLKPSQPSSSNQVVLEKQTQDSRTRPPPPTLPKPKRQTPTSPAAPAPSSSAPSSPAPSQSSAVATRKAIAGADGADRKSVQASSSSSSPDSRISSRLSSFQHTRQTTSTSPTSSSTTAPSTPIAKPSPAPSASLDPRSVRPSVATLVNELTEVEEQVGGDSFDTPKKSMPGKDGAKRGPIITASSATLELDQLMQNLEDFVPPAPAPTSEDPARQQKPKSAMEDLSNMLGSLENDMETIHGVSTVAKGICAACKKPILAKILDALGRQWHPEHFTCALCEVELSNATYYESNGRPYCEKDFHELYAPRCAYCNGPILDQVMRALDKTWHPEHFFCTLCGKKFGTDGFHEKDGKAYCRECYYENYAPRCKRCSKAIMEGFITALNAQWHPECFSCKVCQVTFPRGNYFEHEGEPHCELHYHASRGTLCASCQKPVTGKCVTAMGRKWHPEHFTCAFCLKLLNKGTFKEHRHNPYCQPCFIKLFG